MYKYKKDYFSIKKILTNIGLEFIMNIVHKRNERTKNK